MNARDENTGFRLIPVTPDMLREVHALSGLSDAEMEAVAGEVHALTAKFPLY